MTRLVREAEMAGLARQLASELPVGAVVWLQGEVGAGKTTFARELVSGLGGGETATSPTYGLVHRYPGARGPVFHVDCYRLHGGEEARDLDWGTIAGGDVLLIEWPERAGPWAPPATRTVRLAHADDPGLRRIEIQ